MPWLLVIAMALLLVQSLNIIGKKTVELERLQKSYMLLFETTQNLTKEMISQRLKEAEKTTKLPTNTGEFLTYLAKFSPHSLSTIADLIHLAYFKGWDLGSLQPYFVGLDKGNVDFEEVINFILEIDISNLTDDQIKQTVWGIINGGKK